MALNKATTATIDGTRLPAPGLEERKTCWPTAPWRHLKPRTAENTALMKPEAFAAAFLPADSDHRLLTASPRKAAHGIEISRSYLDRDGNVVKSVVQGDEVTVKLRRGPCRPACRIAVISDLLPGGLKMIAPKGNNGSLPESVKFADRREDRMLFCRLDGQTT